MPSLQYCCPETQSCDALTILRRLCNRVLAMHLPEIAKDFSYSFSGGVVTTEARYPVSSDWMLASADKAVMQARASGCGCVVPVLILTTRCLSDRYARKAARAAFFVYSRITESASNVDRRHAGADPLRDS